MALQSYFIVLFRNHAQTFWQKFFLLETVVVAAGIVLGVLGWWLGPSVFTVLFPGQQPPQGWLIAALVASSALVGALCVTAPAVLARAKHSIYTAGWMAAAVTTIVCLLVPLPLTSRTVLALAIGPLAGLAVHIMYLARSRQIVQRPTAEGTSIHFA
jgi:hypothetical protein